MNKGKETLIYSRESKLITIYQNTFESFSPKSTSQIYKDSQVLESILSQVSLNCLDGTFLAHVLSSRSASQNIYPQEWIPLAFAVPFD